MNEKGQFHSMQILFPWRAIEYEKQIPILWHLNLNALCADPKPAAPTPALHLH